jgi:hypothetical protein
MTILNPGLKALSSNAASGWTVRVLMVMISVFRKRESRPIQWHQCRLLTRKRFPAFTSVVYGKNFLNQIKQQKLFQKMQNYRFYTDIICQQSPNLVSFRFCKTFEIFGLLWFIVAWNEQSRKQLMNSLTPAECRKLPIGVLRPSRRSQ